MSLTINQIATLKALAAADSVAATYFDGTKDQELADWFNQVTTTVVWRTSLSVQQFRAAVLNGVYQLDNLTVGKRDTLLWLGNQPLPMDASVRSAIDDLCGTQAVLKAALVAAEKRLASRAEKALSSGTGSDASPAAVTWEGTISAAEASTIRS